MTAQPDQPVRPLPRRRVTLQDVAREAGVSVTSASRSLHSVSKGARAPSAATVARVRAVAAALGYTRDQLAGGLRTRRSKLIGVLVPELTDQVLATIYGGVEDAADAAGYRTVVANTHDDPEEQRTRARVMLDHRVEGLVFGDARTDDTFIDQLSAQEVPLVLVSRRSGSHPAVACDDALGGALAAEHLQQNGHRNVAVLACQPHASTGLERTRGFIERWRAGGGTINSDDVVHSTFDSRGGRAAMQQVLRRPGDAPTAVFAVNDFAAIGAMGAMRDAGILVGRDIALVGFNDVSLAAELPVPLSSIASPMTEIGRQGFTMLQGLLNGHPGSVRLLTPELRVRASSLHAA